MSGLVITGGEPTLQKDLADFARQVKEVGVGVKLDTNGSMPEVVNALFKEKVVDYIAMDIKAPLTKYAMLCGREVDTITVRSSIELIAASGAEHHFRTTCVPGLLDPEDLEAINKATGAGRLKIRYAAVSRENPFSG